MNLLGLLELGNNMNDFYFKNEHHSFGLQIKGNVISKIQRYCIKANKAETGGIIIGYYSNNNCMANVTAAYGPPPDSKSGSTWFYRGFVGLQLIIDRAWEKGKYYLGEWHYHPSAKPCPSECDIDQMINIAQDIDYKCPEAILFIIGGDKNNGWDYNAMIFMKTGKKISLKKLI